MYRTESASWPRMWLWMGEVDGDLEGPIAKALGKDGDAQHLLNQAVLDYKHAYSKRTLTTDKSASKTLSKLPESRTEKQKRNRERKSAFERNKKQRAQARDERDRRHSASQLQLLRAQTRFDSAANAIAALQRRQSEQFGILSNLFAHSHNLSQQQPATSLLPSLPEEPLWMDPALEATSAPEKSSHSPADDSVAEACSATASPVDASE
ncbi:unnamed protein product [Agarophyton chilense]